MIKRLARWALFAWAPCATCKGGAAPYGDPYGCWDCRNLGVEPGTRKWVRGRRLHTWAWSKVGPV